MLIRFAKAVVAVALFLVAAAIPDAGITATAAPIGDAGTESRSARRHAPAWLAWLRSIVIADESPPDVDSGASDDSEDDESDRGPSMDPDG